MALVATVGAVATQPGFLRALSRVAVELSMGWMEGFYQRGWTFGVPSPPPTRMFEEEPSAMEGARFVAGELFQQMMPALTCAALPILVIGLWTVLRWLGQAVWFTGWILSWIGWSMSGCPCPKRSSPPSGLFGSREEPSKCTTSKPWTSSASVLGGTGLLAGQAMRAETSSAKPAVISHSRETMPKDYKADELLKLGIREDQLQDEGAFAETALEEPGKDFRHYHLDRRVRSGKYRGYRYDDLLTMPNYIAHVYSHGHQPGMEAIKAYYNFAMKHQLAVSAGKDA